MKEDPPPTFCLISCIGSKFTQMSTYPGVSFAWSQRSTASSTILIVRYETLCNTSPKGTNYKASLHRQTQLMQCVTQATPCSECCVPSGLQSCQWFHCTLLFVHLFTLRAQSHCKHITLKESCEFVVDLRPQQPHLTRQASSRGKLWVCSRFKALATPLNKASLPQSHNFPLSYQET